MNIEKTDTISILGCGWYGFPLAKTLKSHNYNVKGSTTSPEKMEALRQTDIDPYLVIFEEDNLAYDPRFFQSKILIICIPPKRSAGSQSTFPGKIQNIINAARDGSIENIIFISSTAVYSDSGRIVTEDDKPDPETPSGKAMVESEQILLQQSIKTTIIRFGGLIGPGRDPARFFAGKTNVPNGQAPVNLIHLNDCIGLTLSILKHQAFGHIFNAVCPDHPQKQDFYTSAALRSKMETPSFVDELTKWKTVSTNHIPSLLKYNYQITDWPDWLRSDKL
jgi:nucleoside-diphosphate-sugar epimerase